MSIKYVGTIILFVLAMGIAYFFYFSINYIRKEDARKEREKIVATKRPRNAKLFKIYKKVSEFRLTKDFIKRLVKIYSVRIPGDFKRAREEATKTAITIWAIGAVAIILPIVMHDTLYGISRAVLLAYVIGKTIVISKMEAYDLRILKELDLFVDDVRHYYFDSKMIDEAIREAKNNSKQPLMKQHADKILEAIQSDDLMEGARKYNAAAGDFYLKKFMASSVTIEQYGDRTIDDESLYLASLRDLKRDIQIELQNRKVTNSKFKFLTFIGIAPYLILDKVEEFGLNSFESLHDIYHGSFGAIVKVLLFVFSFVIFTVLNKLRESITVEMHSTRYLNVLYRIPLVHNLVNSILVRNWGKALRLKTLLKKTGNNLNIYQYTVKRMLFFVLAFAGSVVFIFGMHKRNRIVYSQNIISVTQSTSGASDEDCILMYFLAQYYLDKYLDYDARKEYNQITGAGTAEFDSEVTKFLSDKIFNDLATQSVAFDERKVYEGLDAFLEEFSATKLSVGKLKGVAYEELAVSEDVFVRGGYREFQKLLGRASEANLFEKRPEFAQIVADTVAGKIQKVQSQYFRWYDFVIAFVVALLGYNGPLLLLMFEKKALQMNIEDEIVQFQSVIMILMHIERMTVEQILDWMCMFSRIFKSSIQTCICEYTLDEEYALDHLAEEEPFEPFRRLVENLKMCDRVGVETAFNGLSAERKNFQENRKLDNEIILENKVTIAEFLALTPAYGVVVGYITVPYILAAVGDFAGSMSAVQEAAQNT